MDRRAGEDGGRRRSEENGLNWYGRYQPITGSWADVSPGREGEPGGTAAAAPGPP